MRRLNDVLRDRAILLGGDFTLADAACYYPLWLMKNAPELFTPAIEEYPALAAWMARIDAFGPENAHAMSREAALQIARNAESVDIDGGLTLIVGLGMVEEIRAGAVVSIVADDYGRETVCGTLARVTDEEITLLRHDPELGKVAVHFPRIGYRVTSS